MNDHASCRQCTSYHDALLIAERERDALRRFKAEIKQAFGTDDLERLHLMSKVVSLAPLATVQWGMAWMSNATREAMAELTEAVCATVPPRRLPPIGPVKVAIEQHRIDKHGSAEGPDPLSSYDPLAGE